MNLVKLSLIGAVALGAAGCVWERGPDRADRGAGYHENARGDDRSRGDERDRGELRDRDCMRQPDQCRR